MVSTAAASRNTGSGGALLASQIWNLPPSSWDYIIRQQMGIINPFLSTKMKFSLDPD
jgi:hypothetical protein